MYIKKSVKGYQGKMLLVHFMYAMVCLQYVVEGDLTLYNVFIL